MAKNTVLLSLPMKEQTTWERDYMLALAGSLQNNKKEGTDYLVYKILTDKIVADNAQSVTAGSAHPADQ